MRITSSLPNYGGAVPSSNSKAFGAASGGIALANNQHYAEMLAVGAWAGLTSRKRRHVVERDPLAAQSLQGLVHDREGIIRDHGHDSQELADFDRGVLHAALIQLGGADPSWDLPSPEDSPIKIDKGGGDDVVFDGGGNPQPDPQTLYRSDVGGNGGGNGNATGNGNGNGNGDINLVWSASGFHLHPFPAPPGAQFIARGGGQKLRNCMPVKKAEEETAGGAGRGLHCALRILQVHTQSGQLRHF